MAGGSDRVGKRHAGNGNGEVAGGFVVQRDVVAFGRDVRLEPANKKYPVLRPKTKLAIEGVVSSVIRKRV